MSIVTNQPSGGRSWTQRVRLPRGAASFSSAVPALVGGGGAVRGYGGRSRFVLSPLSLTLDQFLFLIAAALLCFGLVMVQSAEARVRGVGANWWMASFENKNAIHALIAMGGLTLMWRLDYRWLIGRSLLTSPAFWLLVLTVLALLAVFAPGVGKQVNGARRWIGHGAVQLQPSELAKLGLVAFIAAYAAHCQADIRKLGVCALPVGLCLVALGAVVMKPEWAGKVHAFAGEGGEMKFRVVQAGVAIGALAVAGFLWSRKEVRTWRWGFLPLVAIFGMVTALVLVEDFGTTALIAVIALVMMLMAGCRVWHVGLLIPPGVLAVWAMIFRDTSSFRYKRFMAFENPWIDPQGAGYHPIQSLYAIINGGFWGAGLGNGIQKMGYLPEDNTDFIFAVICEELGFIGAAMVVLLYVAFVIIGWRIASRCRHQFGKMLAFGITAMIGLQAAINIAVVTVTMPTKGIALPLISSGGTGWIMNAAAIGVLMSIERINRREIMAGERAGRGAERALGFPVQVHAVPAVVAVPAAHAIPVAKAVPVTTTT